MQELYTMKLHEVCTNSNYYYRRVPGGWYFKENEFLDTLGVFIPYNTEFKTKKPKKPKQFIPPTLKETLDYFKEKGYNNGKRAWEYYEASNWKDSTGKPVKSWKGKMIAVWMRDEFKISKSVKPQTQAEEDEEVRKAML